MKHLYKFIALLFLFIGALYFFGKRIPEISTEATVSTSLQSSTFPIVYLQVGDYTLNTLHGYSSALDSGNVRESITPIDTSRKFTVKIDQNESKIKKLTYDLKDIANNESIETESLTAFDTADSYRTVDITFTEALDTSTEYGLELTLTTSEGRDIHFYTRIKYYSSDCYLSEKMDFVTSFHDATFDKDSSFDITPYLEAHTNDDSTFADVDIHSDESLITWKKLDPEIILAPVPTVKEINIETMSAYLEYFVQIETDSGLESYYVKEFYRVRYSDGQLYLLAFHRTMESFFDPDLISLNRSEFKIGISNQTDLDITASTSDEKFAFVRNGSLWYYDLEKNKLYCVFSFAQDSNDYLREYYDQHDIKILTLDDDGNISFMLYGYMNCGDYEGRVCLLLYDYSAEKNRITERVYIPLETTYQRLKEDLGEFSYVNSNNIFYFSLDNVVYAYNIASKRYDILTEHASRDSFSMLKEAKCFIWTSQNKKGRVTKLNILNLDTSDQLTIRAPKKQSIVLFGTINTNLVYGFVKNGDIYEATTGTDVFPAYRLVISDCEGNILRKYQEKNLYVTETSIEENIIRLTRVRKKNGTFTEASDDTILNQKDPSSQAFSLTTRVTNKMLTEKYLSLPAGFVMEEKPTVVSTKFVMVTENTTLHLDSEYETTSIKYYVYADGKITLSTTSAREAIVAADEQMGVVMDNNTHIVWERSGKFLSKSISNISYPDDTSSSIKACTQMLLQAAQVTVTTSELTGNSILSVLEDYLDQPVSLTGCTLDEVLYFVSGEKPVIAMLSEDHAVLITEYTTSSVTWLDPVTRTSKTTSLSTAEALFAKAGYEFVSYVSH